MSKIIGFAPDTTVWLFADFKVHQKTVKTHSEEMVWFKNEDPNNRHRLSWEGCVYSTELRAYEAFAKRLSDTLKLVNEKICKLKEG